MSKIEEVARAIYAEMPNGAFVWEPNTAGGSSQVFRADAWENAPDRHEDCLRQARAALLAIREPGSGMLAALHDAVEITTGHQIHRSLEPAWQAAIDHALTQETSE